MRVVFVAPFGLGQKTTVWARTLPLARRLVERGCQVTIVIPPWDTPRDAGLSWVEGGVQIVNVGLTGGLPLITARLLAQIGQCQPQIVHIVKPRAYAGIVQWILWQSRRLGRGGPRLVLDIDDWEQAWSQIGGYAPVTARFLDWQERWGIAHADAITAASRWLEEKAQVMAPGTPVLYLPNGIEPGRPEWDSIPGRITNPPYTVLLFSRFVEVEPAWMGTFWQTLRQLCPGVRLVVGGQALQPERERAFRTALDVDKSAVTWLGYVEPQQVADLYAGVDCAIFPAANMPLNQAKCSVRLATTLLRGVPVVASTVGEQANYGAHGAARLIPPDATPEEFAGAVADLLADPRGQVALAQQARARLLQAYDWDRLGDELYDFYQNSLVQ